MKTSNEFFDNCFQKNIQSLQIFIFFLLYSNQKRFPKLPGLVGKCCQIFGIFSLLIPKAYLMSLIVGNDNYTLAFGGLYLLEFIVMISFNKLFWSSFGSKHICTCTIHNWGGGVSQIDKVSWFQVHEMSRHGDPGRFWNHQRKSQRRFWTVLYNTVSTYKNVNFSSFCRITGTLESEIDIGP